MRGRFALRWPAGKPQKSNFCDLTMIKRRPDTLGVKAMAQRRKHISRQPREIIMFRALTFSSLAVAALAVSAPASADPIQVGVLQCAGGPSVGYLIGSNTGLSCVFRPSTRRGGEGYAGSMGRLGLDVGVTTGSGLGWLVFAPSRNLSRGALAGSYGGASANASLIVGGGANVLVGGLNNSITLQPVSVQGQSGVNLAATVTSLQLQSTAPARATKKKKSKKKS
jgi:hypothetical protein